MKKILSIVITLALTVLAAWLLPFGREQRHLYFRDYTYTAEEVRRLQRHPEILYVHGWMAENRMDRQAAMDLYGRATARDALHMDAWLGLAEMMAASGDLEGAARVTSFCNEYIAPVMRWKWPHTLLAHELGMEEIFGSNINYLVAHRSKLNDALQLLNTHSQGSPEKALALLTPDNQPTYLKWAIRWKRLEAAQAAWQAVAANQRSDAEMLSDYVHFLVGRNQVPAAAAVWRQHTSIEGITNGSFEVETSGKGFDWRMHSDRSGHWNVRRDADAGRKGGTAVHIRFGGQDNVSFHHLYQIVPVTPDIPCRLTFWWHGKGLTTDQRPFVELYGYQVKGLYARGPAIQNGKLWQPVKITFTPPADCYAVVVRLRRLPSHRFDSKIRGSLWLDDFVLTKEPGGQKI